MPTLYLNGFETEARLDGERIELTRTNAEKNSFEVLHVHLHDIERVVVTGRAGLTVPLLHRFVREGIPIQMVSRGGRNLGAFYPNKNGHALRRLRQYELAKSEAFALAVAKKLIQAKIRNSRRVLQRLAANREESNDPVQTDTCNSLQMLMNRTESTPSMEELRGIEGFAAALYFKRLATFFPQEMPFVSRSRQPPRDPANALLSWTYTIVQSEIDAAIHGASLDTCLGTLHEISYGRPSLALDLLEPLRAPLCDLLVLRIINHQIIKTENFEINAEDGGTYLSAGARKIFFIEYERSMTRRFAETKNSPHTDFRKVIQNQVQTFIRAMEGKGIDDFFLMP